MRLFPSFTIAALLLGSFPAAQAQQPRFAAVAVDPVMGVVAGVKDMATQERAEQEALRALKAKRPNAEGEIYLSWSGTGCGAVRAVRKKQAYSVLGFGLQPTLSDAQFEAIGNLKRHRPQAVIDEVFEVCNSPTPGQTVAYEKILAQDLERPEDKECYLQWEAEIGGEGDWDWRARVNTPVYQVAADMCPLVDRKSPVPESRIFYYDVLDVNAYVVQNIKKDPSGRASKLLADFGTWFADVGSPFRRTGFNSRVSLHVGAPKTAETLAGMKAKVAKPDPRLRKAIPAAANPCLEYSPPSNSVVYGKDACQLWLKPQ